MPIPVVLDVSEKFIEPLSVGKQITLRTTDMTPLAIFTISEIWLKLILRKKRKRFMEAVTRNIRG